MRQLRYSTRNGIQVTRTVSKVPFKRGLGKLMRELDSRRGFYFSSGYEYPGRYSRWDIASLCPPRDHRSRARHGIPPPQSARTDDL